MNIASSGQMSEGFLGAGGIRDKDWGKPARDGLKVCANGGSAAGKCTIKVCSLYLHVLHHPTLKLTLSWKTPQGTTMTKKVDEATYRRRSQIPLGVKNWAHMQTKYETAYEWDTGAEVADAKRGGNGNSGAKQRQNCAKC